jgi:hypothetical protein
MKVFIKDYKPTDLSSKLSLLDKYLLNRKTQIDIFSSTGCYTVGTDFLYKITAKDAAVKLYDKYYENMGIIIDYSKQFKEVENNIPQDHLAIQSTYLYYGLNNKSNIKFVVRMDSSIYDTNKTSYNKSMSHDVPHDFYFETIEDIDITDKLVKEELSVFLYLLK